jgi:hypothetical protein
MWKLLSCLLVLSCGKPITESGENKWASPSKVEESRLFNTSVYHNFYLLPLSGFVQKSENYWTGDSWSLKSGSINRRWYSNDQDSNSPTYRSLLSMSEKSLRSLSATEKYDILLARYNYPLVSEVQRLTGQGIHDWEGLCHGWAGATINHPEPRPKLLKNPDGIMVPFGSSDIKALLTWAYSKALLQDHDILGKRCEGEIDTIEDYCEDDLSAMNFHLALTNLLGLRGKSLIADIERSEEVWNHPILTYYTNIIGRYPRRKIVLKTTLTYLDVSQNNSWEHQPKMTGKMTLKYALSLSETGNIIGGEWLSRERPDFLWRIKAIEDFENLLPGLEKILK